MSKSLNELIEKFMAAGGNDQPTATELLTGLKSELKAGHFENMDALLPRLVRPDLDYTVAVAFHKLFKRLRQQRPASDPKVRIAVLGSVTTPQIVDLLDLYLQAGRLRPEFYESDYGVIHQEFLDTTSGLHRFRPDFVLILASWRDLGRRPQVSDGREQVTRRVEEEVARWTSLWEIARRQLGCQIIQSNFARPAWRVMGNLDASHPAGLSRFITLVNLALTDVAAPGVTIYDVDERAAGVGRWQWNDERFYFQAKLPCSPEHMVDYAYGLASLVVAQRGAVRKCLVLDLDNTLWGGVIGDDGLAGICLGQGDPRGEAFVEFQRYLRALRERGVILAVCSKNEEAIAREAFEKHPEMVLRLDDFSCFIANWDDKATNLARIARELNIGLDSLVFFDDNPAERSMVRRLRPEVAVPEVPDDPSQFIRALDQPRYFELVAISAEDLQRTDSYRANSKREALAASLGELDDFLRSLEMQARIEPVSRANLERSAQLINRSNQFNLTTRRYTSADLLEISQRANWITRTVSLRDRFGDNGLISVLLARVDGVSLVVDTWLMSCRVLKRGVERLLLNHVASIAHERGLKLLVGEYIPTPKNGLVKDHYRSLGFTQADASSVELTRWELRIDGSWKPLEHFIEERESREPIEV